MEVPQENNTLEVSLEEGTLTNAMMNLDSRTKQSQRSKTKSLISIKELLTDDRY